MDNSVLGLGIYGTPEPDVMMKNSGFLWHWAKVWFEKYWCFNYFKKIWRRTIF